jgi:hypothetical protein
MKNLIIVAALAIVVLMTSCESCSKSGRKVIEKQKREQAVKDSLAALEDSLAKMPVILTPEKIGVSEMETEFTPFPNCDGGEGYRISFTIAVKLAGEEKSRTVDFLKVCWFPEPGVAKKSKDAKYAVRVYESLTKADPKKTEVTIVEDKIVRISSKEEWKKDGVFVPSEILYDSKHIEL